MGLSSSLDSLNTDRTRSEIRRIRVLREINISTAFEEALELDATALDLVLLEREERANVEVDLLGRELGQVVQDELVLQLCIFVFGVGYQSRTGNKNNGAKAIANVPPRAEPQSR